MTTQEMTPATAADAPADFVRVLNPARVPFNDGRAAGLCNLWIQVKFTGGRLSITGVEGPLTNGDCRGSAGQCGIDPEAKPADGYTVETLARLREIWERWHLNDMRPHSPEMAALGWPEEAKREIFRHEFTQTREASEARRAAEAAALAALKAGQPFNPTPAQSAAAAAPYSVTLWAFPEEGTPTPPPGYERARHIGGHANGNVKAPERKTLGWVKPSEHAAGLLGRKVNPDDAHGYGGKWWREEVPADVLAFLQALPERADGARTRWFS